MHWFDLGICVEQHYLGILDLECAATGVDICSIERCLGTLCTLHRVKCKCMVKEKQVLLGVTNIF